MPTLTKFVYLKYNDDGDGIYSFRNDKYFREKLAAVPDGEYIKLGPSKYSTNGFALYWHENLRS
jgi:hypothetical protein